MLPEAKLILREHLAEIFDFNADGPRMLPFGKWLTAMSRFGLQLRSVAMAHVVRRS
ncbi:unnamed protein product [Polarella glacialis]|uniref:Uncharacterized protein n=2 Tax=Polarella glacialis TaxID=89957 RepID=A0A813IU01_POLGL|nr:unnamed protein product [Polarella glacialis]